MEISHYTPYNSIYQKVREEWAGGPRKKVIRWAEKKIKNWTGQSFVCWGKKIYGATEKKNGGPVARWPSGSLLFNIPGFGWEGPVFPYV